MPKDMKIGMIVGLILVAGLATWLSMRFSPSIEERVKKNRQQFIANKETVNIKNQEFIETTQPETHHPMDNQSQKVLTLKDSEEQEKTPPLSQPLYHIVRPGESLSSISSEFYGSSSKWEKIYNANRSIIKNVNKIPQGTKLIIPE